MSKIVFHTAQNLPRVSSTPSGRKEVEKYQFITNAETGERELSVVGMTDMYEKAQLARPDDLYTLLKNSGVEPSDVESLKVTQTYARSLIDDFCSAPRDLVEAVAVIDKAQRSFDNLPLEVREEFDNSREKMFKSLVDGTFDSRIKRFLQPVEPQPKKEVEGDEVK